MKRLLAALCGVIATTSAGWAADAPVATNGGTATPAATVAQNWTATLDSEVRYFSWKSGLGFPPGTADGTGGSGSQLYIPYGLQLVGLPNDNIKIEIVGRGGWVHSRQSTNQQSGEVRTTTDTVVSATATYLGLDGIQPFASVNFNIPTGQAALFGSAANTRMDPDLVDIASFGEGFNFGPTIGLTVAIASNLITTVSVGYTQRGAFRREGTPTLVNPFALGPPIDPGDVVTATATIAHQVGQLAGTITGSVSSETATKQDGAQQFKPGTRYLISGSWAYTWPEMQGVTTLTASLSHAKPNKALFELPATPRFDSEPFNSNSNLYRIGLEHLFPIGMLSLGPTGSYLYRDHNGYNSATLQFVPAKERWSAGALARYAASEKVSFNARVERVWVHESVSYPGTPFSLLTESLIPIQGVPAISSTGWQSAVGANVSF
jgi:hypothetical protein